MNVKAALGQFDLLPLQIADLRGPQTVAISDQDHGRVAMPIAAVLARAVHQALDLVFGEIASLDCQVYGGWSAVLGSRNGILAASPRRWTMIGPPRSETNT